MPEEILRLIGEFVEEFRSVLIAASMKILNWVHQHHPVSYTALKLADFAMLAVVAALVIRETRHVLTNWWSSARRNRSSSPNSELTGEPMTETTGGTTKLRVINREHWKRILEALAWAVVAAFAMLLLQARQVDRWDTQGKLGILVVVLLFGVAMSYLRAVLFAQSRRFKIIEAESFVLKRDGLVLAKLELGEGTFGPGPSFALYDLTGTLQAKLALGLLEASIVLYDSLGNRRITLGVTGIATGKDSDNQIIRIFNTDGEVIWSAP
jgi:hypothetical protein